MLSARRKVFRNRTVPEHFTVFSLKNRFFGFMRISPRLYQPVTAFLILSAAPILRLIFHISEEFYSFENFIGGVMPFACSVYYADTALML
jgi:hypothetical protein